MRILYGCNSQGQGHLSKAAVLVPLLQARGHEVRLVSSGPRPPQIYQFDWHRHLRGLPYILRDGRTDHGRTLIEWIRQLPGVAAAVAELKQLVREFQPELIVSDFEPLTASAALNPGCEVVAMSRQAALLDPAVPLPPGDHFSQKIAGTMIRLFTLGADRYLGFHYTPASHRCLPPILRPHLQDLRTPEGNHLFVYNFHHTTAASVEHLVNWSLKRGVNVRAYGFLDRVPRGREGRVVFQPSDRSQMLLDLAGSRGAIVTAGFTTPLEAVLLKRPVTVVPLQRQWEQETNAWQLAEAGIAQTCPEWDYDRALAAPPPQVDPRIWRWLATSPDDVIDAVLKEEAGCAPVVGQRAA